MMRSKVTGAQRWVVKIGSALLTADGKGLDRSAMGVWVEQMVALHNAGVELVLVSSGAVAAGMSRLGWTTRPSAMHELQALLCRPPQEGAPLDLPACRDALFLYSVARDLSEQIADPSKVDLLLPLGGHAKNG